MKAYSVGVPNENISEIVFAESPSKAKGAFLRGEGVFDVLGDYEIEYTDLRCAREPVVDDMESSSPEEIAYKLIKEAYWVWDDGEIDETNVDEPELRKRLHDITKED